MLNLLQSQLSFFGAIDEAVLFAKEGGGDNPDEVLRIVGTLLPNTTGFGQSGWYHELHDFANRVGVRNRDLRGPVPFPSVGQSLQYLQASTAEDRMRLATAALGTEPTPSPLRSPGPSPLPLSPRPRARLSPLPRRQELPPRCRSVLPAVNTPRTTIRCWRVPPTRQWCWQESPTSAACPPARRDNGFACANHDGGGRLLGRPDPHPTDVGADRERPARRGKASRVTRTVAQLRRDEGQSAIRQSVRAVLRHTRVVRRSILQHALHRHDR